MCVAPLLAIAAALAASLLVPTRATAQYPVPGVTATGRTLTIGAGSAWKVFIPSTYITRPGNVADVLVLLHGDPQTVWNNAKWANLNSIVITANYGAASSAYQTPFASDINLFQTVLDQALAKVRLESDIPDTLQWDQLALASFSAGYGGVREILKSATYRANIDSLLAADSLYATTAGDGTPLDSQMADYKTFALAAKNGQKTFLLSHSKVLTFTYENTIETADELMQYLGITPTAYSATGLGTLNYYRKAQTGNFRIWGANGDTADDHSAHLRYIGDFLEQLPIAKLIPGDYNLSGTVDAADYVLWRKKNGAAGSLPNEGGITPGTINGADYIYWRSRYASVFVPAINTGSDLSDSTSIPEPATSLLLASALAVASTSTLARRRVPRRAAAA
jgi:hypothetical protein